jgi:type II secretory ATPase GspE/PulE/Tfp pilus assembly ATPase PilB-like protein
MVIDDQIRELISSKATHTQIRDAARKNGMMTLFEDGIKKIEDGITSLDEIISVTTM